MQKLIKISDTHYVVVDDSEIKEGDISVMKDGGKYKINPYPINNEYNLKITHSTKPLKDVQFIILSEVEELINGYSVDYLAANQLGKHKHPAVGAHEAYVRGFNAHKKLVKDKLFTIEDMHKAMDRIVISTYDNKGDSVFDLFIEINRKKFIDEFIQSILPKTEWNCRVVNSKIELI